MNKKIIQPVALVFVALFLLLPVTSAQLSIPEKEIEENVVHYRKKLYQGDQIEQVWNKYQHSYWNYLEAIKDYEKILSYNLPQAYNDYFKSEMDGRFVLYQKDQENYFNKQAGAHRFLTGHPETFMDKQSLAIYNTVCKSCGSEKWDG